MSEGKKNIIGMLLEEYDIKSAKDIEEALKDLLGGTIQEMLEFEMDEHLGYEAYERSENPDYRNGKKTKKIRGNFGETEIEVPQDRDGTFEPKIVKKRQVANLNNILIKTFSPVTGRNHKCGWFLMKLVFKIRSMYFSAVSFLLSII